MNAFVRTTCPYCGVGCGVVARPDGQGGAAIEGDAEHPANFGRLCSKGSALGETLSLQTRLLHPKVDNVQTDWDSALDRVARDLSATIKKYGPDSVAFYLSGQLLTEDYYVANKLMKGFIGSANVDTNSRLCMSSSVAGHKRAFGSDTVPGCYEDIDEADVFVLVGSNAAWCHPILFQRMMKARQTRNARFVIIDPRRTATVEDGALHLAVKPGTDSALFSGLLVHLAKSGATDESFVAQHTNGLAHALEAARKIAPDAAATALATGLALEDVHKFFSLFSATERVITFYSQGVNQSAQGTDKVNAILNCHLLTGRIGRPGMGPFSLTGQPNAMGGREVGGLANQLAAHMDFAPASIDRVKRFWNAPLIATHEGLKAVDMFDAIASGHIRALWVMGTNPAVSLPRADAMRAALSKLDLFIVSENVSSNDTMNAGAHVVLPAAAWGEKDGTVTNSERRISRQRPFLPLAGDAKPDWWIVAQVARRMGFASGFDFDSAAAVFREHAALSVFENDGARDFDLGPLAKIGDSDYAALAPVQWPVGAQGHGKARLFADGRFFTPDGRGRFQPVAAPALAAQKSQDFPLLLNTGRVRDQWHTMTRTGLSPRLANHTTEPCLHIHPIDAEGAGLIDHAHARVHSPYAAIAVRVRFDDGQRRGDVFLPMHWNDETASSARAGALIGGAVDPYSGQPELKASPVRVTPLAFVQTGFVVARERIALPRDTIWAWSAMADGFATTIACNSADALDFAITHALPHAQRITYRDDRRLIARTAWMDGERLIAACFTGPVGATLRWQTLADAFALDAVSALVRRRLLSGVATGDVKDEGPIVCACFGVPEGRIKTAIGCGARDTAAIGAQLKAGTNCGSCLPELRRLLVAEPPALAAAAE